MHIREQLQKELAHKLEQLLADEHGRLEVTMVDPQTVDIIQTRRYRIKIKLK